MAEPTGRTSGAESARRILQTLFLFHENRPQATVEEIAHEVGVPMSTAYRYVAVLRELGILEESGNGTYHPTPRVFPLADAAQRSHGLIRCAQPVMRRLAEESGETVLLVRLLGHAAVCVDRVESSHAIRLTYEPGQAIRLQQGASAHLLLGSLPADERRTHLERLTWEDPAFGERRHEFERELDQAVVQGWTMSHGEIDAGIIAVAAPIKARERVVATLSIAGPAFRGSDAATRENIRRVVAAAAEVTALFSWDPGDAADELARRPSRPMTATGDKR